MQPLPGDPSVLQLLLHYKGVYDINHILLAPDGTPLQGLHDVVDRISQYAKDTREQEAEGESQIIYSNANYILLALLVDKASGSLNEFLKEYIFKPFGMQRTFLSSRRSTFALKRKPKTAACSIKRSTSPYL
jgi:CubicO group peptidase (beta-lactamase class C family)